MINEKNGDTFFVITKNIFLPRKEKFVLKESFSAK